MLAHRGPMRRHRRGNAAVIVGLCAVVLFGAAAFAIDVPYARLVKVRLEDVADAAAHAATAQLDGTDAGIANARALAKTIAASHTVAGAPVALADGDIVPGVYDKATGTFTASADASAVNAVRVNATRPDLALFFAPVAFRRETVEVGGRSATMHETGPAGRADCYLPLALPSCLVDRWTRDGLQDVALKTNPAGIDNAGWARIGSPPNAAFTRTQIADGCSDGAAQVGDDVYLQNGSVANAYTEIAAAVSTSDTTWTTARWGAQPARDGSKSRVNATDWGKTLEGVVLVFDGGETYCQGGGGSFNGSEPLVGFVWGAIYDVWSGSASQRTLWMRLDVVNEHVDGKYTGGGIDLGLAAWEPPRRVDAED